MPDEEVIFEGRIPFKAIHWSRNPLWLLLLGWNFGIISSLVKSLISDQSYQMFSVVNN